MSAEKKMPDQLFAVRNMLGHFIAWETDWTSYHGPTVKYVPEEKERALSERIRKLEEALEFYACHFNWHTDHEPKCEEVSCCHREKWKRAEEALK